MIIEFVADVLDLLLGVEGSTSSVCSLPLRDAGLEPKLFPVWSMLILLGKWKLSFYSSRTNLSGNLYRQCGKMHDWVGSV